MGYGINLAIGPSCFVQCHGCYNYFGNSSRRNNLVTAADLLDFAAEAADSGITQATISGGDPLTHPEIVRIIQGLAEMGLAVKLDTVGTALLGAADVIFYGAGIAPSVLLDDIVPYIAVIGVPIDGATQATVHRFRKGRPALLQETIEIVRILKEASATVCINTVVHRGNVNELDDIRDLVVSTRADRWQLFEFQPIGPLAGRNAERFELSSGEFARSTAKLTMNIGVNQLRI